MNLTIDKIVVLSTCFHFICVQICGIFITLCWPSTTLMLDWDIESTTGFIGSGSSARTEYGFLKQYVVSTEIELKSPDEFSYVYGCHCTLDSAMQEMRTSGETQLVCNIPLSLVSKN